MPRPLTKSHDPSHRIPSTCVHAEVYTEISGLSLPHFTHEVSKVQRDLTSVMSTAILHGLQNVATASRHTHSSPHHQGTPHCTHSTPMPHTAASTAGLRAPVSSPWAMRTSCLPQSSVPAQSSHPAHRKPQLSCDLIGNVPSGTTTGCWVLPSWVAFLSPRGTVSCLLPFPQTPPRLA